MKIIKDSRQTPGLNDKSFEVIFLKFLGKKGFILPENKQEMDTFIEACERMTDELPKDLKDPLVMMQKGIVTPTRELHINNEDIQKVEHNLAQAAREGKDIPAHIQRKMEEKRKETENKD